MNKTLELDFIKINSLSVQYECDEWIKILQLRKSKQRGFDNLLEVLMEYKEEYAEWCENQL